MSLFRSARLEALLGATVDQVTYEQVVGLVAISASEDVDLDFKGEHYEGSDSKKAEFAADVASLANAAGGILIIGIAENSLAQADKVADVDVSDTEITRYTSIIAERIVPQLSPTIRAIQNPKTSGYGFVIIAVSRSPLAPHAVRVGEHWRYARRVGRRKVYVSENEIAMAYRDRFTGLQSRLDAAEGHECYIVGQLGSDQVYVVVTLVPDLDGHREISAAALRAFRTQLQWPWQFDMASGRNWEGVSVGPERLHASGLPPRQGDPHFLTEPAAVLHRTGAGSFASSVGNRPDNGAASVVEWLLVGGVLAGLKFLAEQAAHHAGASGSASLRATIVPANEDKATFLTQEYFASAKAEGRPIVAPPRATDLVDLHDLATNPWTLTRATYTLCSQLVQYFGKPETIYLTSQGAIRVRAWPAQGNSQAQARSWATEHGVDVDETKPAVP